MLGMILLLALQSSSTQCSQLGGTINCNTYTPQPYQAPQPYAIQPVDVGRAMNAYQQGRAVRQAEETAMADAAAPKSSSAATSFQEELGARMGILVRQGRCEDAHRLAALAGESELADASRQLCPF